ncbi:cache domain-containing sensor histidine kinase [Neobacillus jeddahensis]|uniref:cache domain-containing sensor histidine kinase n=1 Tax=Neobacillus jeddahensis TaxID=1461580 RepID=UPI00058EBD87|nr:sensor histidine kinase [Neobacillus jeddahensis]
MKNGTLYQKIIIMLLFLTVMPLLTVGYFGYEYFSSILEEKIVKSNSETIGQVKARLDSYITDVDSVAKTVANYEEFQLLASESLSEDYLHYAQTQNFVAFSKLMILTHQDIQRITIVRKDLSRIDSMGRYLPTGGNLNKEKFAKLLKLKKPTVLSPELGEQTRWVIPYVQSIFDPENGKVIGAVIVDLDLQQIQDYLEDSTLLQSGFIVVKNDQGKEIYAPKNFNSEDLLTVSSKKDNYFHKREGKKELVIHTTSSLSNWHIYGVIPYQTISNQLQKTRYIVFLFALMIILAVVGVALFLRTYLVKPIQRLQTLMFEVERGNLFTRSNFKRNDEIGKLGTSFNHMIEQLQQLINDIRVSRLNESQAKFLQKEAQYQALQARIAPHFLYNTLDSVSWLARDKGVREITAVVDSLAGMLRYSLDRSTPLVKAGEEVQHILLYSEIIRFRKGDSIEFDFDVPDELLDLLMPRFTLQPLMENAVQHGLEPLGGKGKIVISASIEENQLIYKISDNGIGLESDKIAELMKFLTDGKEESPSFEKIGLANVHNRIKMTFGEDYGLSIHENKEFGLVIQVKMPLSNKLNYQKSEEMISNLTGAPFLNNLP